MNYFLHKHWKSLLIFTIGLMIFSCQYEPDDTFFKEVQKPDKEGPFLLNIVDYEDTIFVTKKSPDKIYFDYSRLNKKLYSVKATLYDIDLPIEIDESSEKFAVTIDKSRYSGINYSLNLELGFHSGSESLAGELEAEILHLTFQIPVVFDYFGPSPVNIINASNEDGGLKLEWEPYHRYSFSEYIIERRIWNLDSSDPEVVRFEIPEKSKTSFVDHGFLGKDSEYAIYIKDESNRYSDKTTYEVKGFYDVNLKATYANNEFTLSWDKNPFQDNISHLEVSRRYDSYRIDDVNQTSYTFKEDELKFMGHYYFTISFSPKESSGYGRTSETHLLFYSERGQEINPLMYRAKFNPSNNLYYSLGLELSATHYGKWYIKTMDANTFEIKTSKFLGRGERENYRNVNTQNTDDIYVYDTQQEIIYQYDPGDLSSVNSYNLKEITNSPSFKSPFSYDDLPMSDTQVIFLEDHENKELLLVDLDAREVIRKFGYYHRMLSGISPDGSLFAVNDSIYSLDQNNQIEFKYRLNQSDTENDEIYFSDEYILFFDQSDQINIYNRSTGEEVFKDETINHYLKFDPYKKLVIMYDQHQNIKIMDLENGFSINEYELKQYSYRFSILNGLLIHTTEFEDNFHTTYIRVK